MAVPGYARGRRASSRDVARLAAFNNLEVLRSSEAMDSPAVLLPPVAGKHRLILSPTIGPDVARYITLHEIGHIMTGDADELTILHFTGPLPEAEDVVDTFALCGILDDVDCGLGPDWTAQQIRARVPLEDRGWQQHRIPRLAGKVIRMRSLLADDDGSLQ